MNLGEVTQRNRAAGRKRASGEPLGGDGGLRRDWRGSCRRSSRGKISLELLDREYRCDGKPKHIGTEGTGNRKEQFYCKFVVSKYTPLFYILRRAKKKKSICCFLKEGVQTIEAT